MSLLKRLSHLLRALLMSRNRLEAEKMALQQQLDDLQRSIDKP
jgi:hypothetical protein